MATAKIIIEVRGGAIVAVYSDQSSSVKYDVIDWDNPSIELGCEPDHRSLEECEQIIKDADAEIYSEDDDEDGIVDTSGPNLRYRDDGGTDGG